MQPNVMIRPSSGSNNGAFYCPERDFGLQGLRLLSEVEYLIKVSGKEKVLEQYRSMGAEGSDEELLETLNKVGMELGRFMARCRGYEPVTDEKTGKVAWQERSETDDFEQLLNDLESSCDPLALAFILSKMGWMSLNAFFYAELHLRTNDLPRPKEFNALCNLTNKLLTYRLTGEEQPEPMIRALQETVSALRAMGYTEQSIQKIVSDQIVKDATQNME